MKLKNKPYILVAGGTGGHLFPALSLAKILKQKGKVVYLYTDERALVWVDKNQIDKVIVNKFNKKNKIEFLKNLFMCGFKSLINFIKERPKVVIGFGGYPSAPTCLAAELLFVPTIIHESNAIIGRANKILSKMAKFVATGFSEVINLSREKQKFVGNPVRENIKKLFYSEYIPPKECENFNILVIGGSQGAKLFADIIPNSIKNISCENQKRICIKQQVPLQFLEKVDSIYSQSSSKYKLESFFNNMDELFSWAHLVISRGGASSLTEIMISGRPSIVIPLGKTLDNDQLLNATYYDKKGASVMIEENDLSEELLTITIENLMNSPDTLSMMSNVAKSLVNPNADNYFADKIIISIEN